MKHRKTHRTLVVLALFGVIATACDYVYPPFINRIDAPVVLTGADVPLAIGADPNLAVGYRFDADTSAWVQIPIQIDQRHMVGFGAAPGNNNNVGVDGTVYGNGAPGVVELQYSDPGTFVGADPDPLVDADDELAFMSRDAGDQAPTGTTRPANTSGPGLELTITDPTTAAVGYVYLFVGAAGADPSAGLDYVDYSFSLDSGDYKTTYLRADGPNDESSTVTTPGYTLGFGDRWIHEDLSIVDGTGVDILDGHKSQFLLGFCGRSNATFANAEGAFVANIDGPVRGIRSYVGANSGPLTQRTFIFYRDRYEMITDLRVHSIPSVMSYFDFNAAAIGMEYRNSLMTGPVTIDGNTDTIPAGLPDWAHVSGPQGNLLTTATINTTASLNIASFYLDDGTPPPTDCWGAPGFLGASGANITGGLPNTDPRFTPFDSFQSRETMMPMLPEANPDVWAPIWHAAVTNDVAVSSSVF